MPRLATIWRWAPSHGSVLAALGERRAAFPFAHGARHRLGTASSLPTAIMLALQHEYRRLTTEMFDSVIASIRDIDAA